MPPRENTDGGRSAPSVFSSRLSVVKGGFRPSYVPAGHRGCAQVVVDGVVVNVLAHLHLVVVVGQDVRHVLGIAEPYDRVRRDGRLRWCPARGLNQRVVVAVIRESF